MNPITRTRMFFARIWFWLTVEKSCQWCKKVYHTPWLKRRATTHGTCHKCEHTSMIELERMVGARPPRDRSKPAPRNRLQQLKRRTGAKGSPRNQKCYCGSGKKFKNCCLKMAEKMRSERE